MSPGGISDKWIGEISMKTTSTWLAVCTAILVANSVGGGHFVALLHPQAFLIVFLPLFVCILHGTGPNGFGRYWIRVATGVHDPADSALTSSAVRLGFLMGGIGAMIGTLQAMRSLSDPARLGTAITLSATCVFYAFLQAALLLPTTAAAGSRRSLK